MSLVKLVQQTCPKNILDERKYSIASGIASSAASGAASSTANGWWFFPWRMPKR